MPIIEIAEIKIRVGLRNDLPDSLAEGELALTVDTGEMFVGMPHFPPVNRGTWPFKNAQLLTEFSRNIEELLKYSYKYRDQDAIGMPALASPFDNTGRPIIRKLQEKLDDILSVKDYGAKGNFPRNWTTYYSSLSSDARTLENEKITNETISIRKAILDSINVTNDKTSVNGYSQRAVYIPAGVYVINGPLFLPGNLKLFGDGKEKTIIIYSGSNPASAISEYYGCMMTTVGKNTSIPNEDLLPEDSGFSSNNINEQLLHSGLNLLGQDNDLLGIDYAADNIHIEGITFIITKAVSVPIDHLRLIRSSNSIIENCQFLREEVSWSKGSNNPSGADNYDSTIDNVAINIDGMGHGYVPKDIKIIDCDFEKSTYGLCLTSDMTNIEIDNCVFSCMYKGVSIGEQLFTSASFSTGTRINRFNTEGIYGPRSIKVSNSRFKNIYRQGVNIERGYRVDFTVSPFNTANVYPNNTPVNNLNYYDFCGGHIVAYNRFENVGNNSLDNCDPDGNPTENSPYSNPVYTYPIVFGDNSNYNISVGNYFTRNNAPVGLENERVYFNSASRNIIFNSQDEPYWYGSRQPRRERTLEPTMSWDDITPEIEFDTTVTNTIVVQYSVVEDLTPSDNAYRNGTLRIVSDGTNISYDDDYLTLNGPDNLSLRAELISANTVRLQYTLTGSNNATFTYKVDQWNTTL